MDGGPRCQVATVDQNRVSGEQFTTEVHGADDVSAGIQHVVAVCDSVAKSNAKEMSCEVSFESPQTIAFMSILKP